MSGIYVDFDHTISPNGYRYGPQKMDIPPYKGVIETLREFKAKGHRIVIFSCRANPDVVGDDIVKAKVKDMTDYLNKHNIPYDEVFTQKPDYDVIIDDKAIHSNDNWDEIRKTLEERLG